MKLAMEEEEEEVENKTTVIIRDFKEHQIDWPESTKRVRDPVPILAFTNERYSYLIRFISYVV